MFTLRTIARTGAVALAAASLVLSISTSAHASDAGLFGSADPKYDGVFRQSLAIIGLDAVGAQVPKSSVNWLLEQQCADGSFESYRADTNIPCGKSDAINYSGPDSNSTAMGAAALVKAGELMAARKATTWLTSIQNDDSGFPYYAGGDSDANSTGLALIALQTVQPRDKSARVLNAKKYLSTLQRKCASGGGLAFQKGQPANAMASAQAYLGLAGGLPVATNTALGGNPKCARNTGANVGSYLASSIEKTGLLPSGFGTGPDYTSTAFSVLGLTASDAGSPAVRKAVKALSKDAKTYALPEGVASPGALGMLMLVAEATNTSPRDFGGIDLVGELRKSARSS